MQLFGLRERRRGKKHVKSHAACLAPEWANVEYSQNRLFKNAFVFGAADQRAPAGRAGNIRNCTSLHRLSSPSGGGCHAAKNDSAALLTLALWPHGECETIPRNPYLSSRAPLAKTRLPARRAELIPFPSSTFLSQTAQVQSCIANPKNRVSFVVVNVLGILPESKYGVRSMAQRAFGMYTSRGHLNKWPGTKLDRTPVGQPDEQLAGRGMKGARWNERCKS